MKISSVANELTLNKQLVTIACNKLQAEKKKVNNVKTASREEKVNYMTLLQVFLRSVLKLERNIAYFVVIIRVTRFFKKCAVYCF